MYHVNRYTYMLIDIHIPSNNTLFTVGSREILIHIPGTQKRSWRRTFQEVFNNGEITLISSL